MQIHRRQTPRIDASGNCATNPATIPVRISPVPPVAMPGLPVVFTQASPSAATTSVRCPFSTRIRSCSRANFRAVSQPIFCTSAMVHPARRAISPGCGVITSVLPRPSIRRCGPRRHSGRRHPRPSGTLGVLRNQRPHQFRCFVITRNRPAQSPALDSSLLVNSSNSFLCLQRNRARIRLRQTARSSIPDEIPRPWPERFRRRHR